MSYADLVRPSLGDYTAVAWGDQTCDNFEWVTHKPDGGTPTGAPAARLWRSTNQNSVSSGEGISFATADASYIRGGFNFGTPPEAALVVPTGAFGIYAVGGCARLACTYDGSGVGEIGLQLRMTATSPTSAIIAAGSVVNEASGLRHVDIAVSTEVLVTEPSSSFSLEVFYSNQTTVDVVSSSDKFSPVLWARWVGQPN